MGGIMEKSNLTLTESLLLSLNDNLLEIKQIIKFTSRNSVRETLVKFLDSANKRNVYELMDGIRSVREIEKATSINISTISAWGQEWEKIGIVLPVEPTIKGKRKKLFSLMDYGLAIEKRDEI